MSWAHWFQLEFRVEEHQARILFTSHLKCKQNLGWQDHSINNAAIFFSSVSLKCETSLIVRSCATDLWSAMIMMRMMVVYFTQWLSLSVTYAEMEQSMLKLNLITLSIIISCEDKKKFQHRPWLKIQQTFLFRLRFCDMIHKFRIRQCPHPFLGQTFIFCWILLRLINK